MITTVKGVIEFMSVAHDNMRRWGYRGSALASLEKCVEDGSHDTPEESSELRLWRTFRVALILSASHVAFAAGTAVAFDVGLLRQPIATKRGTFN